MVETIGKETLVAYLDKQKADDSDKCFIVTYANSDILETNIIRTFMRQNDKEPESESCLFQDDPLYTHWGREF